MKPIFVSLVVCVLVWGECRAAEPFRLVHRWEHEPDLGTSWLMVPSRQSPAINPARLASPLQSIQLSEAQLIIRNANNPLLQNGPEALQVLLDQLRTPHDKRPIRLSLAAAAIALASPEHADQLWKNLGADEATRPLIERALIDWQRPVCLDLWRERVRGDIREGADLLLAIEGIGAAGDKQDVPLLEALLRNDRCSVVSKLVIARVLGNIASSGLEKLASQVLDANVELKELLAAELLSQHTSDNAQQLLQQIISSKDSSAQRVAYDNIAENYPQLAFQHAGQMLVHPNNNIRLKAIEVLQRQDDPDSLRLQATALEDPNELIRNTVRENLSRKALLPTLKPVVDEVISLQLSGKSLQATEMVIKLAVTLKQSERCPQLFALLEHPQLDLTIYAAWALQELVVDPQIVADIFKFTQPTTKRLSEEAGVSQSEIIRQSFLFEALGRNVYQPASETLKLYVPKGNHKMGGLSRASAIWALGKILQGSKDNALAMKLAERMHDEDVINPEFDLVRYNATLALGWIGATSSVEQLEKVIYLPPDPLGLSRNWSLEQFKPSNQID